MAFKGKGRSVVKAKGSGKAKGKGSGTWAWIPDAAPAPVPWKKTGKGSSKGKGKVKNWMSTPVLRTPVSRAPLRKGKGKATGKGRVLVKGKGKGKVLVKSKGKGKGKGKVAKPVDKFLERLHEIDASLKVWVGGLDESTNFKKLTQHFSEIGKAKVALMPKGKACLAFKSTEEVDNAIATFNGSELGGKTIEVDVWTQKEKKVREPRDKKKKLVKTGFAAKVAAKNKSKDKVSKFAEQLKALDSSLKVFVGKIADDVTIHKLKQHFADMGSKCAVADMMRKKGTACVGFNDADEAEAAISGVDGTEFAGKVLEVSAWGRKEKAD